MSNIIPLSSPLVTLDNTNENYVFDTTSFITDLSVSSNNKAVISLKDTITIGSERNINISFTNITFIFNEAKPISEDEDGYHFIVNNATLTFTNCDFINIKERALLQAMNKSKVIVKDCIFTDVSNYLFESYDSSVIETINTDIKLNNHTFCYIACDNSKVNVQDSTIKGEFTWPKDTLADDYIDKHPNINDEINAHFFSTHGNAKVEVSNTNINNIGVAFFINDKSEVKVTSSNISQPFNAIRGYDSASIELNDCTISESFNNALDIASDNKVKILKTLIEKGNASAIYYRDRVILEIRECKITNNRLSALDTVDELREEEKERTNNTVIIDKSSINNNGYVGITLNDNTTIRIMDSEVSNNSFSSVLCTNGIFDAKNTTFNYSIPNTFSKNVPIQDTVFLNASKAYFNDCTFNALEDVKLSAFMLSGKSEVECYNCTFSSLQSITMNSGMSRLYIKNGTFNNMELNTQQDEDAYIKIEDKDGKLL